MRGASPLSMARLKPSGIRLRVWRVLRESERKEALDQSYDRDRQLSTLRRLTQQAANRPLPSAPATSAMSFIEQAPARKLARAKRHVLGKKTSPRRLSCPAASASANLTYLFVLSLCLVGGELEGWLREDRCTANGRRYSIWIPPIGPAVMSKAAALRMVQEAW